MITLRPLTADDADFVLELYASTRADLTQLQGDPELLRQLVRMQSEAQQTHYRALYPRALARLIVADDGTPAGRLIVDRGPHEIRLVDISLLPAQRRRGIGQQLLRGLQQESEQTGLPLRLSVLSGNPAIHLYQRLGFEADGMRGAHHAMAWRSDAPPAAPQARTASAADPGLDALTFL
jgi:ribosomal protein S18 acetylase RimI-like enzyme